MASTSVEFVRKMYEERIHSGAYSTPRFHSFDRGCIQCLLEEIDRLKRGEFTEEEFQNLCHNLSEEDECRFKQGCIEYQNKLFGRKP